MSLLYESGLSEQQVVRSRGEPSRIVFVEADEMTEAIQLWESQPRETMESLARLLLLIIVAQFLSL